MKKLIKLEKDSSMVFNNQITEFLDPDYLYLPIKKNYHVLIKPNEKVLKGQIIIENNLNKVLSPISGQVIGICKKNINGELSNCLEIQNDFKEKERVRTKKSIEKYDRDSLVSKLYEYYFKYIASVLESKKLNNLVIVGYEDEPYIVTNNYIVNKFSREILEMTDLIASTFNIENAVIALKSNDTKNIENYLSKIGTYPNIAISLIEDYYLLSKSFFLLKYLNLNEMDSLVIDAKTLYEMYYAIRYNKYIYETFITISGPSVNRSQVIKTKIGTPISDIINNCIKLKKQDNEFILNGLMTGYSCDITETVVTQTTKGVVVIPKQEIKESPCNLCGLCFKICPVKVNPKKVMDNHKISNNCIDCGLCSYICPCHINLRKFLRGEYE